ncbi:M48 family metalloprotease [Kribbella qitaiheensis]|uniref:M48 family metalloprotease n=1 Tax=Kribbella qitaiheensis TaxID=1544730 RepID=A0A7G6WY56_9ACTN|nr:M48 family metallopeptidase [Kribbella qitaiheensis]QNE18921.1 M48 family metalloprotease [Kribbella qitaiheensis]
MQTETGATHCPQCSQQVPVDPRCVTWCDKCDWNVDPTPTDRPYAAWRLKLEHRLADTLYRELESGTVHRASWDAARLTAYLLSALLLLVPLTAFLGGIALLLFYRPLWLSIAFAVVAFCLAILFRPRMHGLSDDAQPLHRADAPSLYAVLDRLAEAIGTQPVHLVVVDAEPNIWFARIGWRFRPVVGIGVPAWIALGPQERVAVLAHELGHGKHGDARHGFVVDAAETILAEIQETFSTQPLDDFRREAGVYLETDPTVGIVTRILNATVGALARSYGWLLAKAALRSSQRAEYLADRKAGEMAGSEAAASMLERTLLFSTSYLALERRLRFAPDEEPVAAVRRELGEFPAREIERRVRASRIRDTRTDSTHPPTYLRTRLIRTRPATSARVVLGPEENHAIDRKLAGPADAALRELQLSFPR